MFDLPFLGPKFSKIVIALAIVLLGLLLFFGYKSQEQKQAQLEQSAASDKAIAAIASITPFNNDFMTVFYYPKVESFAVVLNDPFGENKQKALTWFREHQVKNVCDLKIEFKAPDSEGASFRELTKTEKNTPGCPQIY